MKKNLLQLVTFLLCAVLLILNIAQARRINSLQDTIESRLRDIQNEVDYSADNSVARVEHLLDQAGRQVEEYGLTPLGVDGDSNTLEAEAYAVLGSYYAGSEVTLLAEAGGTELRVPMESSGDGRFTAQLALPLEADAEIGLTVLISGGGLESREELGRWGDISMLLPLQYGGAGWSGPSYANGRAESNFHITIEGFGGAAPEVSEAAFAVYRNGEAVQEFGAVADPHSPQDSRAYYTVDTERNFWSLECEPGDAIEIRFTCVDGDGLEYEFLMLSFNAAEEENATADDPAEDPGRLLRLFWNE